MSKIEDIIRKDKNLEAFVKGSMGRFDFNLNSVQISIFKEEERVRYYYRLPFDESCSYKDVEAFMKEATPVISKMIEEERNRKLYSDECISGAKLK